MRPALLALASVLVIAPGRVSLAAELPPPEDFSARDAPNDAGGRIELGWKRMPYEGEGVEYLLSARASRNPKIEASIRLPSTGSLDSSFKRPFWMGQPRLDRHLHLVELAGWLKPPEGLDPKDFQWALRGEFEFTLVPVEKGKPAEPGSRASEARARSRGNLFNWDKLNNCVYAVLFSAIILGFIASAKRRDLFLRRIPGIDAVEEAIGRATEMGKPIYFLTGRNGMDSISTVAATTILGEVAKKVAHYDSRLRVPHTSPIVMAVSQEITKQSYLEAGRPDAYREDSNFFITEDQFSYTAAVDGLMLRERPAACFYMGYYYAEALLLAETGASTGAIQVAGTDAEHQLPFFITTCDYTLIGEELYAASAYLSKQPVSVGTLRGQDVGKAAFLGFTALAGVLVTAFGLFESPEAVQPLLDLFKPF